MATPKGPRKQFRVVNKGKGPLQITKENLHEVVGDTEDEKGGTIGDLNEVTDYRSSFDSPYIYSGFLLNGDPVIKRCLDNTEELAQGVTDLEADWLNRTTLTYN